MNRTYSLRIVCNTPFCNQSVAYQTDKEGVEVTAIQQAEMVGWIVDDDADKEMTIHSDDNISMMVIPAVCPACCEVVATYLKE